MQRYLVEAVATVTRRYEITAGDAEDALERAKATTQPTFSEDESETFTSVTPIKD